MNKIIKYIKSKFDISTLITIGITIFVIYLLFLLVEHIIQYNEYKEFYHMYNTMIY